MRERPFIVVSGLPASGKTTLARALAAAMGLPLLDKDDLLEALFDGAGRIDPAERTRLSRMSDNVFMRRAAESQGAVLVSFWRHPTLDTASGTPTAWLQTLGGRIVEVHCRCAADVAEQHFRSRRRHPGHNDAARSGDLAQQFQTLAALGPLNVGPVVSVQTDTDYDLASVLTEVRAHLR
jgi:glucokinase